MQKCRGKGKLGLDVKGQAGGERGGSRTRCREDWGGKKGWEPEQLSNSSGSSQELVLGENSPYTALHVLLLGF